MRKQIIGGFQLLHALLVIGVMIWVGAYALRIFIFGLPGALLNLASFVVKTIVNDPALVGWLALSFVVVVTSIWIMSVQYESPAPDQARRGRKLDDLRHRLKSQRGQPSSRADTSRKGRGR